MEKNSLKLTKISVSTVLLSLLLYLILFVLTGLLISLYFYIPGTGFRDSYFAPIVWGLTPEFLVRGPVDWFICFFSGFFCSLRSKDGTWLINTTFLILLVFLINTTFTLISNGKLPPFSIYTLVFYSVIFFGAYVKQCIKT